MFTEYRINTSKGVVEISCPESFCQWNAASTNLRCHCDAYCITIGDCCIDYIYPNGKHIEMGFDGFAKSSTIANGMPVSSYSCSVFPIVSSPYDKNIRHINFKTASGCFGDDIDSCDWDIRFGVNQIYCDGMFIYPSQKCLACNGIYHDAWPLVEHYYDCPEDLLESSQDLYLTNFTIFRNVAIYVCARAYELPKQCLHNMERMKCLEDMGHCYEEHDNPDMMHFYAACRSYNDPFRDFDTGEIYKNAFCILCEGRGLPKRTCDLGPFFGPNTIPYFPLFTMLLDADGQYYSPELDLQTNAGGKSIAYMKTIHHLILMGTFCQL